MTKRKTKQQKNKFANFGIFIPKGKKVNPDGTMNWMDGFPEYGTFKIKTKTAKK